MYVCILYTVYYVCVKKTTQTSRNRNRNRNRNRTGFHYLALILGELMNRLRFGDSGYGAEWVYLLWWCGCVECGHLGGL